MRTNFYETTLTVWFYFCLGNLRLVKFAMGVKEYYRKAVEVVCDLTGVTENDIVGKKRQRELVDARCLVVMLLKDAGYYPTQIAPVMGISVRWVQKISAGFADRMRYSSDPMLRRNWEASAKALRTN